MKLTQRTLAASSLVLVLLVAGTAALLQNTLASSYAHFERLDAQQNLERAHAALTNAHNQMSQKATDWAFWDTNYRFLKGEEPNFIKDNVSGPLTLKDMAIDGMAIVDRSGKPRFLGALDPSKNLAFQAFPQAWLAQLQPHMPLTTFPNAFTQHHGILVTAEGPALVAALPITKGDHTGGIQGTFFMARSLDAKRIQRLGELVRLQLQLWPLQDPKLPEAAKVALGRLQGPHAPALEVVPESEATLAGYALVRDVTERPAMLLKVALPRTVHAEGQRTIRSSLLALALVGLVVLGLNVLLLRRLVLSRLDRLAQEVIAVGQGGQLSLRITVEGEDELAETATAINRTLGQLQSAQEAVVALEAYRKGEARYTGLMDLSPSAVVIATEGKVAYANGVWAQILGLPQAGDLVGEDWLAKAAPDEAQRVQAELERLTAGEVDLLRLEAPFLRADGQTRDVQLAINRIEFREKPSLQINAQDVTEAKQAQEEVARMGSELSIATRIQTALVPMGATLDGFDLALDLVTATEVGGDLVDVLPLPNGRFWLAVGDVTGHGLTPGLVMMMAQSMLSAMIAQGPELPPSAHLVDLNGALYQNVKHRLGSDHYMTLQLLRHDGEGRFLAAGMHCDVVIHRAASRSIERLEVPGFWTGLLPDVAGMVQDTSFQLEAGDLLVLYSDGLIEAMNGSDEQFDMDRLEACIARNAERPAAEIKEALLQEVRDWLQVQLDDISIVVARYLGHGPEGPAAKAPSQA